MASLTLCYVSTGGIRGFWQSTICYQKWLIQFSLPQIVCPLVGSSKISSHVDSCHCTTIVTSDCTIVTSSHQGSIRTTFILNNSITQKTCKMTTFFATAPSGYSIWGPENCKAPWVYLMAIPFTNGGSYFSVRLTSSTQFITTYPSL